MFSSPDDVFRLLAEGNSHRTQSPTGLCFVLSVDWWFIVQITLFSNLLQIDHLKSNFDSNYKTFKKFKHQISIQINVQIFQISNNISKIKCFNNISNVQYQIRENQLDANAESSRSHAVFCIEVEQVVAADGVRRLATLTMVDLAGSERAASTGVFFKKIII